MTQEALRMALEALITASGHLNNEAFVKVMMARDAVVEALAQPEQEPFAWGVDWGKAGDIACVSIIKRLPNDVIEVVAVEYAPYSYTHPPQRTEQEPVGDEWIPCMKLPVVVYVRKQRLGETHVSTREGITPVKPDDLIMRGVSGEEYPIGRAIFEQTYSLNPAPPQRTEQNFCSRCGKRTKDIHTCTPPMENI